jgi:hypothetical protein
MLFARLSRRLANTQSQKKEEGDPSHKYKYTQIGQSTALKPDDGCIENGRCRRVMPLYLTDYKAMANQLDVTH